MNIENITEAVSGIKQLLDHAKECVEENIFLKRVIRQAIMTHNGELKIDPQYGVAASNNHQEIFFGNGKASFTF